MFVGHLAPAFVAKTIDRQIPLWVLVFAALLLDVIWSGFVALGIERIAITPGITAANPLLMFLFIKSSGIMVIPVLILNGLFLFGSGPVLLALVHDIDSKRMSFINGIYMTLNFVLGSLMVLAVGAAADRVGLDLTYKASAAAAVACVLFVIFMKVPVAEENSGEAE